MLLSAILGGSRGDLVLAAIALRSFAVIALAWIWLGVLGAYVISKGVRLARGTPPPS